jgi:hypothetical protein
MDIVLVGFGCSSSSGIAMHLVCRRLHRPRGTFVSGGRPEGSEHDPKFHRARWPNLMGWVV